MRVRGIMVTGSHNPPDYNGFKMVLAGEAIYGDAIQALYQAIERGDFQPAQPGRLQTHDIKDAYIQRIAGDVKIARPIKIAVDAGNGVAGAFVGELYRAMGCDVTELFCEVDGHFPNHHPDPAHPENLEDLIAAVKTATPNSAWPSTATATASASSPRMARSSSRTAR
jgi:phosphomannomutase/phosphoglucomutase